MLETLIFVSVSELDCQRQLDRQALVSARVSNRVDGSDSTWPGTGGPLAQNRLPKDAVTSHLLVYSTVLRLLRKLVPGRT